MTSAHRLYYLALNFLPLTGVKKTDIAKYISLCLSALTLALVLSGFPVIAGISGAAAIFVPMFSPHKSSWIFVFTFFCAAFAIGFTVDYPFDRFPAALIGFLLIAFIYHFRTFFYKQMLVSRAPWFEALTCTCIFIFFIVSAVLVHYDLRQWLTSAPLLFFWGSSFIIYKDRNDVLVTLQSQRPEVKVGTDAPEFSLPDQNGNVVTLHNLLENNHVLLIFVRGDWCPTCHMMLRSYFKNKEKFAERNVRIVGIGPDPQGVNKEIMQRIDEHSVLLSDDTLATALLYSSGLQPTNPINQTDFEKGVPLPASFLVHQNGKIAFASRSDKPGEILQPDLIFEVLETFV